MGRCSRFSIDREDIGSKKANLASFQMLKYQIGDFNVGRLFNKYQADAVTIVNKFDGNELHLHYFRRPTGAASERASHYSTDICLVECRLDNNTLYLYAELDKQLAMGEEIQADASSTEIRKVVVLYEMIELKLPVYHNLFSNGFEDTYCHQVIDALVASHFPARSGDYVVDWTNGEAHGSKRRRGYGYRPDASVRKHGRQIAFLEIKPPGSHHGAKEYVWAYWYLTNYAKAPLICSYGMIFPSQRQPFPNTFL
ncbi:hypothetical protein BKA57DRAFT_538303 [Linnemannia elongata]|nr:hypothetical protein BKA57DRAFT_538303 [Linnemannia elongata]